MRHHLMVSAIALAMAAVTAWLFLITPKGFLPNEDAGRIIVSTEAQQGVAFEKLVEMQQEAGRIIEQNPGVEAFMSRVGGGGRTTNTGRFYITL